MIGIGEQRLKKIFCCVIVAGIATVLIQITSQSISTDKITQAKKQEISLNQTELTDLQSTVASRSKHLQKICSELKENGAKFPLSDYVKERLLVDLEKKILFCPIPKAGSSNWKRIFAKLTTENYDEVDDLLEIRKVHHIQLPVFSDFSSEKQKTILREFKKFVFVRHPFDRVLSAFRNKLENPFTDEFQRRYGTKIVTKYRPYASDKSKKLGDDVSFTEFIHYLTEENPSKFNNHWQRYWDLCQPCALQYDFIGTAENYQKEAELLTRTLNITVTFPEHEAKTTAASSLEVFGSLSKAYLSKLYNIYKIDFAIFNYTIDHFVQLTKS